MKNFRLRPIVGLCKYGHILLYNCFNSGENTIDDMRIIIMRNSPNFSYFGRSEQVHRRIYNVLDSFSPHNNYLYSFLYNNFNQTFTFALEITIYYIHDPFDGLTREEDNDLHVSNQLKW